MAPSTLIVKTPFYEAYQYGVGVIGIVPALSRKASDATAGRGPVPTDPHPDEKGDVNFFEEADGDAKKLWLSKLAEVLVREVVIKDIVRQGDQWTGKVQNAIMSDFPKDYILYVHKTGHRHAPRTDHYLYGSRSVKCFRSPAEFAPHLIWLMTGGMLRLNGKSECECQYCSGDRPQLEISAALKLRQPQASDHRRRELGRRADRSTKRKEHYAEIPMKDYRVFDKPAPGGA